MRFNAMVRGIGTDIIEVNRIRKALQRHKNRFCNKLFTETELSYCLKNRDPAPAFAARFAAKEAIAKALGVGLGGALSWLDMEIRKKENGCPYIKFSANANSRWNFPNVLISISHSKEYATAFALYLT